MGLDFTTIKDSSGAAIYLLHDGTTLQQRAMDHLREAIDAIRTGHQVVVISAKDPDGQKIREFYNLDSANFPHVMVVQDDDQLAQLWSGQYVPDAQQIAYTAQTASSS